MRTSAVSNARIVVSELLRCDKPMTQSEMCSVVFGDKAAKDDIRKCRHYLQRTMRFMERNMLVRRIGFTCSGVAEYSYTEYSKPFVDKGVLPKPAFPDGDASVDGHRAGDITMIERIIWNS